MVIPVGLAAVINVILSGSCACAEVVADVAEPATIALPEKASLAMPHERTWGGSSSVPNSLSKSGRADDRLAGKFFLSALASPCVSHTVKTTTEDFSLTPRELEVARLFCAGLSTRGAAHLLRISEQAVHRHKAKVYSKLGVRSQAGLIWWAIRERLMER